MFRRLRTRWALAAHKNRPSGAYLCTVYLTGDSDILEAQVSSLRRVNHELNNINQKKEPSWQRAAR